MTLADLRALDREALAKLLFDTDQQTQLQIEREAGDRPREAERWDTWKDGSDGRTYRAMADAVLKAWAAPELLAVAEAAQEAGLFDDWDLDAEDLCPSCCPKKPEAFVAARKQLHAALAALDARLREEGTG